MAFAEQCGPYLSLAARVVWGVVCGGLCSLATPAAAQDQPLLSAPSEYTDVIDAFDGTDPLDVQARIEFRSTFSSGTIQREVIDESTGRQNSNEGRFRDVVDHSGVRNELQLGLEVGLWHDLMLFVGLPIVLSDDEEVALSDGVGCDQAGSSCDALQELPVGETMTAPLFVANPRVVSEQRSGLARVELGLAFGLFNQFRGADATWVLRAMLAVPAGDPRAACIAGGSCAPGLSDGSMWLTFESRWSRRYRYVEPLIGISHRFGWVTSGEEVFSSALGSGADDLPTTTEASAGAAIVPWEDRMRHQRFSVELLGRAAYISKGRGMSPLFDALGTSGHTQLNADGASPEQRFTGVTTIGAHGRLGVDLMLVMKAARYVRFTLGTELGVLTDHLLTGAEDCSADGRLIEPTSASSCPRRRINPLYRPVIDAPGQRFRLDDALSVGLIARAQGQF